MTEQLAAIKAALERVTPGPWRVWEGPEYVGGGADLCIGAGDTWIANMDHRRCQDEARHLGRHDRGCALESDTDICSMEVPVTVEQRANAELLAQAPAWLRALVADVERLRVQKESDEYLIESLKGDMDALRQRHVETVAENTALRAALVGFVGSDDPKELDAIEVVIRGSGAPSSDMAVAINGIDALRKTASVAKARLT